MMQHALILLMLSLSCAACAVAPSAPIRSLTINQRMILAAHNEVRAPLGLPSFTWSARLADYAQVWANTLATHYNCSMQHRSEVGREEWQVGENLFWAGARRWTDGRIEIEPISPRRVVALWAGEVSDYDYAANQCRFGAQCGHYTQIVWRDTQELGCAAALCGDLGQIWVCNYSPAGNWLGQRPY